MLEQIIVAGFGGQGILLLGKILAEAALMESYQVTWLPSYGAEMRGGASNCHICISDQWIGSPLITEATAVMALDQRAIQKYENVLMKDGLLLLNSSIIQKKPQRNDIQVLEIPATTIATKLGDARYTNMVMLGAYLACKPILKLQTIEERLKEIFANKGSNIVSINLQAMEAGAIAIKQK